MSDLKAEGFRCLTEHQNEKMYTAIIVDFVILALATEAITTIVAYYLDGLTIKNHIFTAYITQIHSITIIEVCFINGHYNLIVEAKVRIELYYKSTIFKVNKSVYIASHTYRSCWQYAKILI